MTKPMVLCVARSALAEQSIPTQANGIYPFDLSKVDTQDFQFINRKICDDKDEHTFNHSVGYRFPQILPYIAVTDTDGKYLTYSRNGTETRLHGSRSIGIGGHVDIDDLVEITQIYSNHINEVIDVAAVRELEEEVLCGMYGDYSELEFNKLIVDTTNSVGKVHVGLFTTLVYPEARPQEELHDPQWLTVEELKTNIDQYENWSKLIIKEL